ncbi:MAG: NADPH:quinone reductase [Planctomycetota bacterium]
MRAIRVHAFGGPEVMQVEEVADPIPGPGEVLVAIAAAGVNPVDTYIRSGAYGSLPDLPYTPGLDAAGVIEAVGKGVDNWQVNDRVVVAKSLSGCYTELAVCPADGIHALPDRLSFEQGAAVNVNYVTAFRALLDHGRMKATDRVFVHGGTGGVGLAAIQICRGHGVHVDASGGTDAGRAALLDNGAASAVPHGALDQLAEPPTLILENLADANLQTDLDHVAPGGRIVIVGSRGDIMITPRVFLQKHPVVTGMNYWDGGDVGVARAFDALSVGLANGDLNPVVGQRFKLADAPAAHEAVMTDGKIGKVVLTM